MICYRCQSVCETFRGEVALHFVGLDGLKKPLVWLFPEVHVCFGCGTAEFAVPDKEQQVLITGQAVSGTIVSESQSE